MRIRIAAAAAVLSITGCGDGYAPSAAAADFTAYSPSRWVQIVVFGADHPRPPVSPSDKKIEASAIAKAKATIAGDMRDPSSAQFNDVRVTGNCNGVQYVKGAVNAKNGYGGYVGFQTFFVRVEGGEVIEMWVGAADIRAVYPTDDAEWHAAAVCSGYGV